MLEQFEPLLEVAGRIVASGLFPLDELPEDPRIGERPAADRNGSATGLLEHAGRVGNGADIPVADDRNSRHCFHHATDAVAVDHAAKTLRPRAAVDGDRGHADLLELGRELGSRDLGAVPAQPHLHGDGDGHSLNDVPDQLDRIGRSAHQAGARAVFGNPFDRATHVDVDRVHAASFQELRRLPEDGGFAAKNLHGKREFLGTGLDHRERFGAAPQQAAGIYQVRRRQADAADPPNRPPK